MIYKSSENISDPYIITSSSGQGNAEWYYEDTFSDVTSAHWAYPYIEAIAKAGLTSGYPRRRLPARESGHPG